MTAGNGNIWTFCFMTPCSLIGHGRYIAVTRSFHLLCRI